MDTNVVLVHDPYDVFLAVGFGFCYGSALLPAIRTLEKYKEWNKQAGGLNVSDRLSKAVADWKTWVVRVLVLIRGALTIVGLACLYGWYASYLKSFYSHDLPGYRICLDWISLGFFAIGASCWDNEDHYETLYGVIQGLATLMFAITCYLAIPTKVDTHAIPLLKAVYWCVIIINAYIFDVVVTCSAGRIFKSGSTNRRGVFILAGILCMALVSSALLEWFTFTRSDIADRLNLLLGSAVFAASAAIFVIIMVLCLLVETKTVHARVRSILLTFLPMSVLIWVTFRNYKIVFPQG